MAGPGFSGLLGPAPPVYDPGGPVLFFDRLDHDGDLASVEDAAAAMGTVLGIIPVPVGDGRNQGLAERDWSVASQWYLGQPEPMQ